MNVPMMVRGDRSDLLSPIRHLFVRQILRRKISCALNSFRAIFI